MVAKLRGILALRRMGHGGTLDPMATGVLPIFFGKATKAISCLPERTKRYRAVAQLGTRTDTGDMTGEILEQTSLIPSRQALAEAMRAFVGKTRQTPPMYSAVKVDGKRLYELARAGKTAERKPRLLEIFSLELIDYDEGRKSFSFDVHCMEGGYIRTLAEDIAASLGSFAALSALRRVQSGPFLCSDCVSLEGLISGEQDAFSHLLPQDRLFPFPQLDLNAAEKKLFLNGVPLRFAGMAEEGEQRRVCADGILLGLVKHENGTWKKILQLI